MRTETIGNWAVQFFDEMEVKVYCVRSKDTGLPVYVGSTSLPVRHRIRAHAQDAKNGSLRPFHIWLRTQTEFTVEILEVVANAQDRHRREQHWVAAFDGLLNLTDGGPGQSGHRYSWSEDQKARTRTAVIKQCESCGTSFRKKPSQLKKTAHSFCSRDCYQNWLRLERTEGRR